MIIFVAIVSFCHVAHCHFRFDKRKIGEVLYHQRYTAFQIEDQIKAARKWALSLLKEAELNILLFC